jgi:ATPase subunit of ABC transporter with duplicated ATPase domains
MSKDDAIIRFENVSFGHGEKKPILTDVSFVIRRGAKLTLMGQNGAGKSTIFGLLTGVHTPDEGEIHIGHGMRIATARQVIPRAELDLSVRDFFQKCFEKKQYNIDVLIDEALEVVNLKGHEKVHDRIVKSFSGGQQARLLLASALIQAPDILLLDEPTNNLDHAGIEHLTDFLKRYHKTVIVISHDAAFLNAFTHGVLYLDVYTRKVEQYVGDYNDVLSDITARIERENMKNAQLEKKIEEKRLQANVFAHKGGGMRMVAKKMRQMADELEEDVVDVRKEDKTIRAFTIPVQPDMSGVVLTLSSIGLLKQGKSVQKKVRFELRKNRHLLLKGPNGIGKSTFLEKLAHNTAEGAVLNPKIHIGYYRQDFSTLNFKHTVMQALEHAAEHGSARADEARLRTVAASFLITGDTMHTQIEYLSEGQKGLVAFACLVLQRPGLLILDEPTNHINFRHLPVIAKALHDYEGAMILVSHVPEFVSQVRIDDILDLGA